MKPRIRVLHALSILHEDPTLVSVPPTNNAGCAPCWNIYHLHEALDESLLETEVISPCTFQQLNLLEQKNYSTKYKWFAFSEYERKVSHQLNSSHPFISAMCRRLIGTNTWLSYRYLKRLIQYWRAGDFDLFILDDAPQNLQYLSRYIPREQLGFFFRGEIGMSRHYLDRIGILFVTNNNLAEYAREVMPSTEQIPQIHIVPNSLGTAFSHMGKRAGHSMSDRTKIIFSGRFVPEKGILELVRAFQLVNQKYPKTVLIIVGGSKIDSNESTEYVEIVRKLAESLPSGAVRFHGAVPYSEIPILLSTADIAVFPSVWVEGFGMVALEAMRCKLPVIVSNRPGFTSFIKDGQNGLVVNDPTNQQELSNAIISLIEDSQLANQLAQVGYQTSLSYTPQMAAKTYQEAISKYLREVKTSAYG